MDLDPDLEALRDLMWEWDFFGLGSDGRVSAADEYDQLIHLALELISDGNSDETVARQLIDVIALVWLGFKEADDPSMLLLTDNIGLATTFVERVRAFYFY